MRLSINCRLWGWDFCLASFLPSSVVINNSNFLYSFSWIIISWCCKSCCDFYFSCLFLGFSTLFFCDLYGYLILNSIAAISFIELSISLNSCLNSRKWPCKQDCSISTLRSWVMHSSSSLNYSTSFFVLLAIKWSALSLSLLTSSLTRNSRS